MVVVAVVAVVGVADDISDLDTGAGEGWGEDTDRNWCRMEVPADHVAVVVVQAKIVNTEFQGRIKSSFDLYQMMKHPKN